MVSLIVLGIVFLLIAIRQVGRFRLRIWQIMLLGAIAVLVTGQISPLEGLRSINPDVMLFLFGVFIIGRALEESGYVAHLASRLFSHSRSVHRLVISMLFLIGFLSAVMMNDTLAIIGTGLILALGRKTGASIKVLLLTVAFAVTIGSVMSPAGNPQNLLISLEGDIRSPFVVFIQYLAVPTIINLGIAYGALALFYRRDFRHEPLPMETQPVTDASLARWAQVSFFSLLGLILVKIVLVWAAPDRDVRLSYIALLAALPVLVFSRKRLSVARGIDWSTLVFFAAMFVLMAAVWNSGAVQSFVDSSGVDLASAAVLFPASIIVSQFVSNVPLVAMYLPILEQSGAGLKELLMLAAGSTIAGNLTILGAASNVIIIQKAEKDAGQTISFLEFLKIGLPLTLVNALVYWLYLSAVM